MKHVPTCAIYIFLVMGEAKAGHRVKVHSGGCYQLIKEWIFTEAQTPGWFPYHQITQYLLHFHPFSQWWYKYLVPRRTSFRQKVHRSQGMRDQGSNQGKKEKNKRRLFLPTMSVECRQLDMRDSTTTRFSPLGFPQYVLVTCPWMR